MVFWLTNACINAKQTSFPKRSGMATIITAQKSGLSRQAIQKQRGRRKLVRLFCGAYINAKAYGALDLSGQYRVRAEAFLDTHPNLRAWGITAAALEGAPVLSGAPLHFAGSLSHAKSRQKGCSFHAELQESSALENKAAQTLFECALSSPLPDALLAANHLLRNHCVKPKGELSASRDLDDKTTEAFVRLPLSPVGAKLRVPHGAKLSELNTGDRDFLESYSALRTTRFSSPAAELMWLGFAQLCMVNGDRRGIRKAMCAGLFFTDQAESPAESLLVARCVELGFAVPCLQVNILDPESGKHLGRVDGLWPSSTVQRGLYQEDGKFGRYVFCKQRGDFETVVIEFDGRLKYQDNYAETLERERERQNLINNLGFRFVRINWDNLIRPEGLRLLFAAAGIPRARQS
jgi:hypothetical protein